MANFKQVCLVKANYVLSINPSHKWNGYELGCNQLFIFTNAGFSQALESPAYGKAKAT